MKPAWPLKSLTGVNVTLPSALSTALPPLAAPTLAMRSRLPSTSVSLFRNCAAANVTLVSSTAFSASGAATGASFTGCTFTATLTGALSASPSLST